MLSPPPNMELFRINRTRLRTCLLFIQVHYIVGNKRFDHYTVITTDGEKENINESYHMMVEVSFTDGTSSQIVHQLLNSRLFKESNID